jgi:hypothetical protein
MFYSHFGSLKDPYSLRFTLSQREIRVPNFPLAHRPPRKQVMLHDRLEVAEFDGQLFSKVKLSKWKQNSRITNEYLQNELEVATSNNKVDTRDLIGKQCQAML